MAVNKVIFGGATVIDLTSDTVTEDKLVSGATAHNAKGERITGRARITASDDGNGNVTITMVIGRAVQSVEGLFLVIKIDPVKCILFCAILIFIFTATVLFPIKNLRKMKISEQLKYE